VPYPHGDSPPAERGQRQRSTSEWPTASRPRCSLRTDAPGQVQEQEAVLWESKLENNAGEDARQGGEQRRPRARVGDVEAHEQRFVDCAIKMVQQDGVLNLWRGFIPIWAGFAPQVTMGLVPKKEV